MPFATKCTHPRRPPSRGRSALTQSGERPPAGGIRSVLPELVPVDLVLRQQLAQLRGRGALHRLLVDARQRRLAQGICRQHGQVEAQVLGAEDPDREVVLRSEEHTSELQSLMRISYAVFCLKKKTTY